MKRKIQTAATASHLKGQHVITLPLNGETVPELTLMLILLRESLVRALELDFKGISIHLTQAKVGVKESTCLSSEWAKRLVKLSIASDALDYWIVFLLRYYRDGRGEARHVDIDFRCSKKEEVTLTVELDKSRTISNKEMSKLLEL